MLLVVLSNCFLICRYSRYDVETINLRNQDDFRMQLVEALMELERNAPRSRKRRVSGLSGDAFEVPIH